MTGSMQTAFEILKQIGMAVIAGGIVIVWIARRFPTVAWLRPFQLAMFQVQLSEPQKARRRRWASIQAGLEIMILGLLIPAGYVLSKVMMFDNINSGPLAISLAAMLACFVLGFWVILKERRRE